MQRSDTLTPDFVALAAFYSRLYRVVEGWDSSLRELGLDRRKFLVLMAIKSRAWPPGPSIQALAASTLLSRNTVRELVTALARQRLITRTHDRSDRRRAAITLTDLGEEWLTILVRDDRNHIDSRGAPARVLSHITPALRTGSIHDDCEHRHPLDSANSVA
jgi:DNA-binding MarR family transcriptional regulator